MLLGGRSPCRGGLTSVAWLWLQLWWCWQMDLSGGKDQRRSLEGNAMSGGVKTFNLQQFSTRLRDNCSHKLLLSWSSSSLHLISPQSNKLQRIDRTQGMFLFRGSSNISILQWKWLHTCTHHLMPLPCVSWFSRTLQHVSLSDMLLPKSWRGKAPMCSIESGYWRKSSAKLLLLFSLTIASHFCFDLCFQTCLWSKRAVFPFGPLNQNGDAHSCQKIASVLKMGLPGAPGAPLQFTHLCKHLWALQELLFRRGRPGWDTAAHTSSW